MHRGRSAVARHHNGRQRVRPSRVSDANTMCARRKDTNINGVAHAGKIVCRWIQHTGLQLIPLVPLIRCRSISRRRQIWLEKR